MPTTKPLAFALSVVAVATAALFCGAATPAAEPGQPHYDADGRMVFPAAYREWVFLSYGLNMSYSAAPAMAGADTFGNTFVPAPAWRAFLATGGEGAGHAEQGLSRRDDESCRRASIS